MDRGEFLEGLHPPEPQHGALSSSEGKVAVFDAVILPSAYWRLLVTKDSNTSPS